MGTNAQAGPSSLSVPPAPPRPNNKFPTRKQNIACDQCRSRKVRCLRSTRNETCEQCSTRREGCTSRYIDTLEEKKKIDEDSGPHKRKRKFKSTRVSPDQPARCQPTIPDEQLPVGSVGEKRARSKETSADYPLLNHDNTSEAGPSSCLPAIPVQTPSQQLDASLSSSPGSFPMLEPTPHEKQQYLIRYLLSPHAVVTPELEYTDLSSIQACNRGQSDLWEEMGGRVWKEAPTEAHKGMTDIDMEQFVDDLIDRYFAFAHARHPCYDPLTFRARFNNPQSHSLGALPAPILATTLAWGARFSDNPIIQSDIEECCTRDGNEGGRRSRMVQMMVIRSREVCEAWKIWRVVSMDNVKALVNIEGLLGQFDTRGSNCLPYATAAIKHMMTLGYNSPRRITLIQDEQERSTTTFLWWLLVFNDGYYSVFYRSKPLIMGGDYDFEPSGGLPGVSSTHDNSRAMTWFSALQDSASMCRSLSTGLSTPRTQSSGIPLFTLRTFIQSASAWRSTYIPKLDVISPQSAEWDFLQPLSDAAYHALWLLLDKAVGEFGVVEENAANGGGSAGGAGVEAEIDSIKRRVSEESELSAMRLAALSAIWTEDGYLGLDTGMMLYPIYEAGLYFARQGRAECMACIVGLRQYMITFPAVWEHVQELERIYGTSGGAHFHL